MTEAEDPGALRPFYGRFSARTTQGIGINGSQ
jgi:hypothetical protein